MTPLWNLSRQLNTWKMLLHGNREDFTHHDMEILITEDVVEVVGRGRGRGRGWLSEDVAERDIGGGRGRFHVHGKWKKWT